MAPSTPPSAPPSASLPVGPCQARFGPVCPPTGSGNGGGGGGIPGVGAVKNFLGAVSDPFGYLMDKIQDWLGHSVGWLLGQIITYWLRLDDPELDKKNNAVDQLQNHTRPITAAIATAAVLVCALRIVLQRNGREAGELAKGLVTMVVLSLGGVSVVMGLQTAGDLYTTWIIGEAASGKGAKRLNELAGDTVKTAVDAQAGGVVIILLMVLLSAGLLQIVLFAARSVGLVLLTGTLPLVAAAGVASGAGQNARQRHLTMLVTFVVYKPAAGTIYAGVLWIWSDDKMTFTSYIEGVVGICMAVFVLIALQKLIAPAVSAGTAAWSNQSTVSRAAAVTSLANGAISLGKTVSRSGGGGRTGSSGTGPQGFVTYKGFTSYVSRIGKPASAAAKGGGAAAKGAAAGVAGGVIAAAVLASAAPAIAAKKIGKTGASGIGQEDY